MYYYEVSSEINIYIIGNAVYVWKKHNFETIFTSDDVLIIQYDIGNRFGYRDRAY